MSDVYFFCCRIEDLEILFTRGLKKHQTPQALRSGASQALDSLVNLPPEGGSRRVVFTRPSSLKLTPSSSKLTAVAFGADGWYAQHGRGRTLRGLPSSGYFLYVL
jgi:hypothetical protein